MVLKGDKTAADAARLFGVNPATVSRLLSEFRLNTRTRLPKANPRRKD
jgi:transposase-like protein